MKTFDNVTFKGTFRDYQKRILDNAEKYLLNKKINIVAAPGSGKTILGLELIRSLNCPAIILSPTTTIKYQWGSRFEGCFLNENENIDDYFSYDLHEITLINSITYQALHSIMNKLSVEEDGVLIDYSDIDIFELVRKYGVKTICLDEAHHLQNEWQKSLEKFIDSLGANVNIIALTATPPYDAGKAEWERYEKVCGPIDEEIFVPELIKEGTLCPHQDYIYFNYPTEEEVSAFQGYKNKVMLGIRELRSLSFYQKVYDEIVNKYNHNREALFENTKEYISLLILLSSLKIDIDVKIIKSLTSKKVLPNVEIKYYEIAYQFLLDNDELLSDLDKIEIEKILKKYSLVEKGLIVFSLKENIKHKLISSIGKLNSISKIVLEESNNMGDSLRMLILTDYIKKETIKDLFSDKAPVNISVVTIFECLVKSKPDYKMGVLSGNLIILPTNCVDYLKEYKVKYEQIGDTIYSEFIFTNLKNKDKVNIVSNLFEKGIINIIIGTKALLGEGWDSPCINTLILASFVGSFMLSNQMRGRAIRIDKNNPNKIANIWHLVTLEPDYIFEENLFNSIQLKRQEDYSKIGSYDYQILERRFECFVGPNYTTGEIENGIDRITNIKPPFNRKGIKKINEEMLLLAKNRDDSKSKWEYSIKNNFKLIEEVDVPKESVINPITYHNYLGLMCASTLETAIFVGFYNSIAKISATTSESGSYKSLLFLMVFLGLFFLFTTFVLGKIIGKILSHSSPRKNMTHIAKALLKTLQELEQISHKAFIRVNGNDVSVSINLVNASTFEQNIFNSAINEMFSPIDNPRYILIFKKLKRRNYGLSYACPSILGQKKAMVDLFEDNLQGRIGEFSIVYTRNDEGRLALLKAKKKSFINQNDRVVKKKKRISVYE